MFKITPIGSCRIYSPLRQTAKDYGFQINIQRVYGYSHSSGEAVQQMRLFSSDVLPDESLWPLLSMRNNPSEFQNQVHEKSDLYVVELASTKNITIDDCCVQLNYLSRYFKDFFSSTQRSADFTSLCRKNDPVAVENFLKENWYSTPEQQKETDTLKRIKIAFSTEQSLYDDICTLQEGLENVLFVTHVNATDGQNQILASRQKFIDQVTSAAKRAGVDLYNPTSLMKKIGQVNAIEDYSTSLAHFTEDFSRRIFADWYKLKIRDMIEEALLALPEENINRILVPHAGKILEIGDPDRVEELADLLDAVEGYFPENLQVKQMQMDMAYFQNDQNRIRRLLFQIVFTCDISQYHGALDMFETLPNLKEWVAEILGTEGIPATSLPWLKKLALFINAPEIKRQLDNYSQTV